MRHDIDTNIVGRILRDVAAREIMPRWRNLAPGDISTKSGPDDLVTVADQAAENALARELTAVLPGSVVVGEETFAADPSCLDHLGTDAPAWIIDPIDGTRAFSQGRQDFASMVALVHGQERIGAWILHPVSGALYDGMRGAGVWLRMATGYAQRLEPKPPHEAAALTGIVSGNLFLDGKRIWRDAQKDKFREVRPLKCAGMDYPGLLRGEVHFSIYSKCLPWDHIPGTTLLGFIGYASMKLDGTPYRVGDMDGGVISAPSTAALAEIRSRLARD